MDAKANTSSEKIAEALDLLNKAAKEKKEEVRGHYFKEIQHLKGVHIQFRYKTFPGYCQEKCCRSGYKGTERW